MLKLFEASRLFIDPDEESLKESFEESFKKSFETQPNMPFVLSAEVSFEPVSLDTA
jgi:hypothetical protein